MDSNEVYENIKRGPTFLLLGQDYLRLETGTDPFLSEVLRKYSKPNVEPSHYKQIFEGEAQNMTETALAWMQERCAHLPVPKWLEIVASFPWSGIYTSSIDMIWPRVFQSGWRELEPVFEEKRKPIDPRNRFKLHCTFLFGRVDQADEDKRPPLRPREWLLRKQVAVGLARRLPEVLTPFGVLLVEGYAGEQDWFTIEDLVPIIDILNKGQTHLFSVTEQLTENPLITDLVEEGKVILHHEGLATFLLRGMEAGYLELGERPEEKHGRNIQIGEKNITIPSKIWTRVSASATILDDSILAPIPPLSEEKRYDEFRQFLSRSNTKPLWQGYALDFAFPREFEKKLHDETNKKLKSREQQPDPVILHGQTGTGKTIALGSLAYKVRKERKHAVLFVERRSQRSSDFYSDLDVFCEWAENNGAQSTLLVWDGMVELEQYNNLQQYLIGRGRKVVLVGSSYLIDEANRTRKPQNLVEAEARLSTSEIADLINFLESFDPSLSQMSKLLKEQKDTSFLVAIYRLLPPTRTLIRSGLREEVNFAEQEMQRKARDVNTEPAVGALAYALWKANFISKEELFLSSDSKDIGGELVTELQELIGLVMVPGRFGLKVPIELLLRALAKETLLHFVELLKGIDIFRWEQDAVGNIAIGPRHPLEAKLVAQNRLGGAQAEVAFARQLLIEVNDSDGYLDNPEVQFAVDLIRNMGPNNDQDADYFAPYFQALSEILSYLREMRGVQNPRLMLQEATLLRETVMRQDRRGASAVDAQNLLDKAAQILHQALELLGNDRRNNRFRGVLLVELGSTLGVKVSQTLNHSMDRRASIQIFEEARDYLFKVLALDSKDYRPIDVLAWMTRDLLNSRILDEDSKALIEVKTDILHVFDIAQAEDLDPIQLNRRRMEIGNALGNLELTEDAFNALLAQGSCAGYYLRAFQMAGGFIADQNLNNMQRSLYLEAAKYLEENRQAINRDGRCLHLLLRLWWMGKTGKPMFSSDERQTVPFSTKDWQYCLTIILDLMATSDVYTTPRIRYLQGLATFHIGKFREALQIFRELERSSENQGRRRIIRTYLASDQNGQPRIYDGTVQRVEGNKGEVYVGDLRDKVPFFPRDFNRPNIQRGEAINHFHIAFNFIGLIADPESFYETQKQRRDS